MRRKVLLTLAALTVLGGIAWAAIGLGGRIQDTVEQDQIFERLRKTTQAKAVTDLGGTSEPQGGESQKVGSEETSTAGAGHDIAALQRENPDCIGWISIEGTNIDYPVMQTLEDPEFYLKHNFDGDYNDHGVPFLDARCNVQTSDNLIVYGHHMADGTMFSALHKYAEKSYWEKHPIITLETADGVSQYQVAAVMRVSGTAYETQWSIFQCIDLNDAEVDQLASHLAQESLYDTGITPLYGDKLLTLSTCEYTQNNGRLVVIAVKQ